jgi:integrin beta 3
MKTEQIKAMIVELAPVIREFVASEQEPLLKRIAELEAREPLRGEKGEDGRNGIDGAAGRDGANGKDGAAGRDGVDATPVTDEQIASAVARYLEINPPAAGKNGVDGAAGRDGVDGAAGRNGEPGQKGADGRDGIGLAGAVIDRAGDLVVTLTNGEHKNLGPVLGKDGTNGRDGSPGTKGADGRDGADGLGFDDFDLIEGEKGLTLRFARGDVIKEFPLPVVIDRGVWRDGPYAKGSGTSWAGSFWIAQRDTSDKPDTPDSGWRLAVKRGRDGKDGKAA